MLSGCGQLYKSLLNIHYVDNFTVLVLLNYLLLILKWYAWAQDLIQNFNVHLLFRVQINHKKVTYLSNEAVHSCTVPSE